MSLLAHREPEAPAERRRHPRFFECTFIWSPNELPGDEPYAIFEDARSDPFFRTLVLACRGEAQFRGVITDPAAALAFDGVVLIEGPVWARRCEQLQSPSAADLKVVLYFENDPSGFWDYAKALGPHLGPVFEARGLPPERADAIAAFAETWSGGRVSGRRILPMSKYYTRDFRERIVANGASVAKVMAALADDESRACYARILFGTNEQVLSAFSKSVFGPQQYMDIARIKPGDVLVNCGVGNGWELPYFLARMRGDGQLINFDPNMVYEGGVYGDFIAAFSDMITDHKIIVGDHDGELKLPVTDSNMVRSDASVRESDGGDGFETYKCRALDSLMRDGLAPRIDLIKMDVEGGEIFILKGAIETIKKHRPKLAVAIYHEPEHFWDYPNYLIDQLEDYRFYVRQYGYSRFETLLYAIPKEADDSGSGEERLLHGPHDGPACDEPVLLYFRDRVGAERDVYYGKQRVVTRFSGTRWETGEMRALPRIDNDDVAGVFECADRSIIVGKHAYAPDRVHLLVGESVDGIEIEWTAASGTSAAAMCMIVDSADGGIRFVAYEAAKNAARLFRYEDRAIVPELDLAISARPVSGRYDGGILTLDVLAEGGRAIKELRYRSGGKIGEGAPVKLGGPIIGAALIKRYTQAGAVYRPCFVTGGENGVVQIVEKTSGGAGTLGALTWDDRFEPLSVIVPGRTDTDAAIRPPKAKGAPDAARPSSSGNAAPPPTKAQTLKAPPVSARAQAVAEENQRRLNYLNESGRQPFSVMIQVSGKCNLKCRMCGHVGRTPNSAFMTEELYRRVLNDCRANGIQRLHLETAWGEPLLHPKIFEFLEMASDFDILLSTNGTPLTEKRIEQLAALNLHHIQVSFGGSDATSYETTYVGAKFDRVSENIRQLKAALVRNGCKTDFLVNGVIYGDDAAIEAAVQYVMSLGVPREEVLLVRPHNYGGYRYESEAKSAAGEQLVETYKPNYLREPPTLCSVLLNSPAVLVDGRVTACGCIDNDGHLELGHIQDGSVMGMRFGERFNAMLDNFMRGDLSGMKLCAGCDVPYGNDRNLAVAN